MQALSWISSAAMPVFLSAVVVFGLVKRVDIYDAFVTGAKRGISLSFRILPYVVGMIFAIRMLEASGAFTWLCELLSPIAGILGLPPEVIPVALMRPFSGGASLGLLAGIFTSYGADSYIGRVASAYMGSSETLFYTVSLYFGSVGVKKTRYVIPVALVTDFFGMLLSCLLCRYI